MSTTLIKSAEELREFHLNRANWLEEEINLLTSTNGGAAPARTPKHRKMTPPKAGDTVHKVRTGMSAAARKRISIATKARWARMRKEKELAAKKK